MKQKLRYGLVLLRVDTDRMAKALPFCALAVIAVLMFAFYPVASLMGDDWMLIVGWQAFDEGRWVEWSYERPLLFAVFNALATLFGLNLKYYMASLVGMMLLAATLIYSIARRLMPGWPIAAFLIAALTLTHPGDYSRLWLTMNHVWTVVVFFFVYALLLLVYSESGRILTLVVALIALLLSFALYEAQLGVAAMWSLMVLAVRRPEGRRRRLGILTPLVMIVLVVPWKLATIDTSGTIDGYLDATTLNPGTLLNRQLIGVKMQAWSWIEATRQYIGHGATFDFSESAHLFMALAVAIASIWVLIVLVGKRAAATVRRTMTTNDRKSLIFAGALVMIVGGLIAAAGYVPMIAFAEPSLAGTASRHNLFANPGAAAAMVGALMVGAGVTSRTRRQVRVLLVGGAVPLLLIGLVTQLWVQKDWSDSWREQRQIWNELFEIAPDFEGGTTVFFILPGYKEQSSGPVYWKQPPMHVPWTAEFGLHALYDSRALKGDVILPEQELGQRFAEEGILYKRTGEYAPYEQSVVLVFDGSPRRLRLVGDVADEFGVDVDATGYAPNDRILESWVGGEALRELVHISE